MRSPRSTFGHFVRLLCAMMLAATAANAFAVEAPRVAISAGRTLRAGQRLTIRVDGLPLAADEFEILLVSDSFSHAVRLTPELPASTRSFDWTVPSLPAGNASVVLRMSIGGEEIEVASSQSFAIEASGSHAPQFTFRDGEWWAVDSDSHGEEGAASGDRVSSAPAQQLAALPPSRDQLIAPAESVSISETIDVMRDSVAASTGRSSTPLTIPQRN